MTLIGWRSRASIISIIEVPFLESEAVRHSDTENLLGRLGRVLGDRGSPRNACEFELGMRVGSREGAGRNGRSPTTWVRPAFYEDGLRQQLQAVARFQWV